MTLEQLLAEDAAARQSALAVGDSCIVRAPAGSGKTELLIQRYLALLTVVEEPEEIIAITFTRKAAGEMRARVVKALESAAGPAPEAAHERSTWELARRAAARDAERAWHLGEHPARMRIQTIDSLNAELTRQMPVLARFGAQPRVAEQARGLYEEAARRTLHLLDDGDPAQSTAMAALLRHLDDDLPRVHALITDMLPRRDQWLRQLKGGARRERAELTQGLHRELVAQLTRLKEAFPQRFRAELVELAVIAAKNLKRDAPASPIVACAGITDLPAPEPGSLSLWRGIASLLVTKDDRKPAWRRRVDKTIGFPPQETGGKQRLSELLQRLAEQDGLLPLLSAVLKLPEPDYSETQWQALEALLTLLPLAVAQLKLVFAERGEVDFPEVALSALTALGEPEAPTDLALALDYRIRHLLVDEFQDTSVSQFHLLEMLTIGWQPGDGRTLFLVGDPAQSIYRFREAEVGLFLKAWESGFGGLALKPLSLHANFRSCRSLVEWYNRVFPGIFPSRADVGSGAVSYEASAPQRAEGTGPGLALHPLFGDARDAEADLVCRLISEARAERPQGKIAVLVRAKSRLVATVRRLRSQGVHFQALEVETLADQPVVQDLLALTRALSHVGDRTAWLAVLRAPWCGLSLEQLLTVAGPADATIPERLALEHPGLATERRYQHSRGVLLKALAERGRGSLRAQVERTWLQLGGPAAVPGGEALADAEAYLELLEELDEGGTLASVSELEEELVRLFARPDPEADGSLQLMTIHKAKGLEFDVVILPGLDATPRSSQQELLLWLERPRSERDADLLLAPLKATGSDSDPIYAWIRSLQQEQEQLEAGRLLYVAATRAREQLHLIGITGISDRDGERSVRTPRSRSLLALLWPEVAPEFASALDSHLPVTEAPTAITPASQQYIRLKADWSLPPADPAVQWAESAVLAAETAREFEWVGETLRHVGTVVHRLLQRMAADGGRGWDAARVRAAAPRLRQMLVDAGVREAELESALADVVQAAENTLDDPKGRWLLSDEHAEAASEYALCTLKEGRLVTGVMDRSFVDAEGVRWIVDYKTSRHSGSDVEAFLVQERTRYTKQLETYAALMRGREQRRVKVALYFPLLRRLVEWEPAHGREP